ncbi:DUF2383 domain-containing protein [Geosporobacter ferrireducens]|uniref:DUF2383 domain-containing protein n=1 Tax=Geosporobacter ferrireducens TaxID=1424294 RepID=A0A1D8GJX0_9FIRM|nr:DUF2383 domain-containing protein [Geosporobacter ferrireducens]AOT71206.1 hypothetical protein Gferi_17585 [Geosporobacter ferrireducens]MTI58019.1 DUF2383 domain-containing protein [Geosporobacter ferrireducens]
MDEPNMKTLNEVLQGEYMAFHAFEDVADKIEDPALRSQLYHMQSIHQENVLKISKRMEELGGHPRENRGFSGLIADVMLRLDTTLHHEPQYILRKLYDGEDKGIAVVEKIITGDLDQKSAQLVQEILSTDHNNLKNLQSLIRNATK